MPTLLFVNGFRFFIYLNEHLPKHVHVKKGGARAKIILEPVVEIDKNYGFKPQEVREIVTIVEGHYSFLIDKWDEIFNR